MKEFTNRQIKDMTLEEQRAYYKAKFERATWATLPDEQIIQAHESYPPYWFVSSQGYVVSVYYKEPRKLKIRYDTCGLKNKNGDRHRSSWYLQFKPFPPVYPQEQVESGNNIHVRLHVLINAHFPRTYIPEGCEEEPSQTHHCEPVSSFAPDQAEEANRAENLRKTVDSVHNYFTKAGRQTLEENMQRLDKLSKGVPVVHASQEVLFGLLNSLIENNPTPEVIIEKYPDNDPQSKPISTDGGTDISFILREDFENQDEETDFIDIVPNIRLLFNDLPSNEQPVKFNSDTGEVIVCGIPGKVKNWENLSDSQKKALREQFVYINYKYIKAQEQQEGGEKQ